MVKPWSMVSQAAGAGRVLAHKYRLESHLGEGGFGTIWRAHHLVLEAPVAVKLIDPQVARDVAATERFLREAKAAANLRSPHVVQILDYGVDELQPFIVMELLEGETLALRIKRVGPLGAAATVRIVSHIARAIGRAHEMGIIHRDLKPENVFLVKNDDDEVAKVLDFGLAKMDTTRLGQEGSVTRTGSLLGSPFYMSPEQAQGNKEINFRSDLWSLGVIGFEMMTGKRPFTSEGLGDLVLQICVRSLPVPSGHAPVPASFDRWFARACARDPDARFQSARELSDGLREALEVEADDASTGLSEEERAASPQVHRLPSWRGAEEAEGRQRVVFPETAANETEARAAQAPTLRPDALTAAEFGAALSEVAERPRSRGVLVAVAVAALAVGLVAGVMALRARALTAAKINGSQGTSEVTPAKNQPDEPEPMAALLPPSSGSAEPALSAVPGIPSAELDAAPPRSAKTNDAGAMDVKRRNGGGDGGPPASWLPVEVDGSWVKPEWARPDPEPHEREEPAVDLENPYR